MAVTPSKYYRDSRGVPGVPVTLNSSTPAATPTSTVIPAVVVTDEAGNLLGTAANPLIVNSPSGGEAVTIADGADVAEGATNATAYTDATGAAAGTLVGLNKGKYVLTAAMSAKLPASLGIKTAAASLSVAPASDANFVTIGNVASGAADSLAPVKVGGKYNLTNIVLTDGQRGDLQLSSGGALLTVAGGISGLAFITTTTNSDTVAVVSGSNRVAEVASINYGFDGTQMVRLRGDTNGLVTQSSLTANRIYYNSGSAVILSNTTTAVTMFSAAGSGVRNYLSTLQLASDTLGAATFVEVRDGAGGTILFTAKVQTTGLAAIQSLRFDPPLKGTANTLMEIVTTVATVTGGFTVSAQGYQGA